MNKIALIGGGGFIGKNLVYFFYQQGWEVLIVNRSLKKEFNNLNVKQVLVDIKNSNDLLEATFGFENVIWLVNDLVPTEAAMLRKFLQILQKLR